MPQKKTKVSDEKRICPKTENAADTEVNASVKLIPNLNFECVQNIIKYLPIKDRIGAERVSQLWSSASKSSWRNFKSLNFESELWGFKEQFYKRSNEDRLKKLENVLSRCGKYLTSLSLEDFSYLNENLNIKILDLVKTNCTNLKSFYTDWMPVDEPSIQKMKVIMKNLQNLQFSIHDEVTDEDLKPLFASCTELENLNISAGKSIRGDFLYFLNHEKIKVLELDTFKSADPMYYALQKFENLQRLTIGGLSTDLNISESHFEYPKTLKSLCIRNDGLYHLSFISKMTSLTKLQFTETIISDSMLFQIARSCKELQILELDFDTCYGRKVTDEVTDRGIKALSSLSKLEELRLSWMDVTGSSFKHFRTLKKLAVSGSYNLNGKSLCEILLSCTELEELSINAECQDDDDRDYKNIPIDFFTSGKQFLKLRLYNNNKPLKIVLFGGFVIVTSNILPDSEKVKLHFEVYTRSYYEESQKILSTNNFIKFINILNSYEHCLS